MARLVELQFGGWPPSEPAGFGAGVGAGAGADATKKETVGGRPRGLATAGRGGGAIWALDGLLEPVAVRFRFHFEEERPTNRTDREFIFLVAGVCVTFFLSFVGIRACAWLSNGVCRQRRR